jgi:hypothetical protein
VCIDVAVSPLSSFMRRRALPLVLVAAAAGSFACGKGAPPPRAAAEDRGAAHLADDLAARARAHEPSVSALLGRVASDVGGSLAGFEHRLKTRASLLRKIEKTLHDHPTWNASDVFIGDALRYTIEVGDQPAGHHVEAVRAALARCEAAGHRVAEVKNYWPRGDNYSGVNAVLVAPDGLSWELQFHTPESFRLKNRDRVLYEELREAATPPGRKRELYDRMAAPWESVPIPLHILEAGALHRRERIIRRPPP